MLNVLVTGAGGFIGKNFISKLQLNPQINILEYKRSNDKTDLKGLVLKSDFIYHLAGEVRPTSSDTEFKSSNVTLSKEILEIFKKGNKKTVILYVSSIHAKLLKNEYGRTKRESEILIEEYSRENDINCFIYRLPHVFGEECKANYNSVVSTWIYNSIKGLDINVFDRGIEMHYVYVQDIVNEFIEKLSSKNNCELYIEPDNIYETTLGDVVDYIKEFKENINNTKYLVKKNIFKEKLFITYKDYWRKLKQI